MRGHRQESTRGLNVMEVYEPMNRIINHRKELIFISRLAIVWHVRHSFRLGLVDDLLAVHGLVN